MFFKRIINVVAYAALAFLAISAQAAPLSYYLGDMSNYRSDIITPKEVLGAEVGKQHIRHDQLVRYLSTLAEQSERILLTQMGTTYQHRNQILLTISSEKNLSQLESILTNRDKANYQAGKDPVVVWLGYSVHGDEISGAHAALVMAYHLAASQNKDVSQMLDDVIIVIEPSINPDGMDRFANWVATYKGLTPNADPEHIEHHQHWPSGRTNHFWFDLNRDWLLLSQKESRNRLKYFHYYQPNVLGDFHEMGANGTYFFQPGIPTRTHPLTPKENVSLTQLLAKFHAKALDADERLYYSEESFDDFYYGKGSTYPDVNGSVGILFEQASSRGEQQETDNGLLTFEYGIKNHVITSLSTVEGAWRNSQQLKSYREDFYQQVDKLVKKDKFWGYIIHEPKDSYRLNMLLSKLSQHQIDAFPLSSDFRLNSKLYGKETTYFVPLKQPQYRLIKAIFSTQQDFPDNTFYDVSGWTIPHAMNIEFAQVDRAWGLKLSKHKWQPSSPKAPKFDQDAYAYAVEWHHYLAPKMLNQLLENDIKVKVATKAFGSEIAGKVKQFQPGTLLIPAEIQQHREWRKILQQVSEQVAIPAIALNTGLTVTGIDLGSRSFSLIKPRKVMMLGGKFASQYEAGEVRYYIDNQLAMPLTIVEQARFSQLDISAYSHIILVDGQYAQLSQSISEKIKDWVKRGGTLIAQKRAVSFLIEQEMLQAKVASSAQLSSLFDTDNMRYQDKESLAGRKRIAGAIFEADLDLSHPLAYGFTRQFLPMFKNSTVIIDSPSKPFMAVAKYVQEPLLSGYTDQNLVNRIAHNTPLIAHNYGKGRIIASSENLVFRGYWHGTSKILANALFFDRAFSVSMKE